MIKNDLHVHSINSDGIHTYLEVAQIAINKNMSFINISDHGPAHHNGLKNFSIFSNKNRLPSQITLNNKTITILKGIESSIIDDSGNCDIPYDYISNFDLINIGFHEDAGLYSGTEKQNTNILINFLKKHPSDIDILVHPCIKYFPIDIPTIVDLSLEYKFALEINNTNLRSNKTNLEKLKQLLKLATEKGAILVENSDGHTYHEIGENEKIEEFIKAEGYDSDKIFMNRNNDLLEEFINKSKQKRQNKN